MAEQDIPQIYLTTPANCALGAYGQEVKPILEAVDIACLRLGFVSGDLDDIKRHADELREIAHPMDIPVLITDHHQLVGELGLDGVHRTDGIKNLRDIRKDLAPDAILGSYCAASRHAGMSAGEIGADYVSFGPVVPSKLADEHADLELFQWWVDMIELPVVAEGMLDREQVEKLHDAVDFFAFGEEIWGKDDSALKLLNSYLEPIFKG